MNKWKHKITTLLALALTLGGVFPTAMIGHADTLPTADKAVITAAVLLQGQRAITAENPVGQNTDITVSLDWEIEAEKLVVNNEQQVLPLPQNLTFTEKQMGALGNDMGYYQVVDQQLVLTFAQNYTADETDPLVVTNRQDFRGNLQLTAKTKATTETAELIVFNNNVQPTIYYMSGDNDEDSGDDPEPAPQAGVQTLLENLDENDLSETADLPKDNRANTPVENRNGYQIFKNFVLSNKNGPITTENPLLDTSYVKVDIDWALDNAWQDIVAGDTFTYKLPDNFPIYTEITNNLVVPGTSSEEFYGTYTIGKDGVVTVKFNDNIENCINRSGTLTVESSIELDITKETEVINTEIKDSDGRDIILNIPVPQPTISKKGVHLPKTDQIKWEIIVNENHVMMHDPKITDYTVFEGGTGGISYASDTMYYWDEAAKDWVNMKNGVDYESKWKDGGRYFNIKENPTNKKYKVVMTTNIGNPALDSYSNKADITGNNFKPNETVASVGREDMDFYKVQKDFDSTTGLVDWEIKLTIDESQNWFTEKTYSGSDASTATHYFVEPFKWFDAAGKPVAGVTATTTATKDNKPVALKFDQLTPGTYVIKYQTQVFGTLPVLPGTAIKNYMTYKETISVESTLKTPEFIGVVKSNTGIDYENKTTSWKVVINSNYEEVTDILLKDIFQNLSGANKSDLHLIPESLVIKAKTKPQTDEKSITLSEKDGDYTVTNNGNGGFNVSIKNGLKIGEETKLRYTVTFKTGIDKAANTLYNTAFVEYDVNGKKQTESSSSAPWFSGNFAGSGRKYGVVKQAGDSLNFPENPYETEKTEGNLATKDTIYWSAMINYNKSMLPKGTVITEMLQPGQTYDVGSLLVREVTVKHDSKAGVLLIDKLGDVLGSEFYTVKTNTDGTLSLTLAADTTKTFAIFVKTTPDEHTYKFTNKINIKKDPNKDESVTLTGEVSIAKDDAWLTKEGAIGDTQSTENNIFWNLVVNKDSRTITNASIVDTVDYNQQNFVLDANNLPIVEIYEAEKDPKDTTGKKWQVKEGVAAYTSFTTSLTTDSNAGTKTMTINFTEPVTKPYIVKYTTKVNDNLSGRHTVKNDVQLMGLDTVIRETDKTVIIEKTTSSGTAQATIKSLSLIKVGDHGELLGASFELYSKDGQTLLMDDIVITSTEPHYIAKILGGEYLLKETVPPPGYVTGREFEINLNNSTSDHIEIKLENHKATSYTVKKVWENDEDMAGKRKPITVELYDKDDETTLVATKDLSEGNWNHTFTNIPMYKKVAGKLVEIQYIVKEKNVPANYTSKITEDANGATITNTYQAKSTTATLQATKTLTGRPEKLQAGEFSFELKQEDTVVETVQNDADGNVNFAPLTFTKKGTYTYTITEKADKVGGVTNDSKTYTATVAVTDNNGQLEAAVTYNGGTEVPNFINTYQAKGTEAVLTATKVLDGRDLKAGEFTFELKQGATVKQTKHNDVAGQITFDAITYDAAGTYKYTISEKDDKQAGITYDTAVKQVTVLVTDDSKGNLTATVTYDGQADAPSFTNKYEAKATSAVFTAVKELTGRELAAGEFSFELKAGNTVIETVTNDAKGAVAFTAISYDKVGTHHYTITEKAGSQGGITYDTAVKQVTVVVTDDKKGNLQAAVSYDGKIEAPVFTNKYEAKATSAVFTAVKELTGRDLVAGEFSFELKAGDTLLQTKQHDAKGAITFDAIDYTAAGTYQYTISEVADNVAGITYDTAVKQVTVVVTDDNQGNLNATVTYDGKTEAPIFTNKYEAKPVSVNFTATKTLSGRDLAAGEFTFQLKAGETLLQTKTNDVDGMIAFDAIDFTQSGEFNFTITEKTGTLPGVTYDTTVKQVKVVVTDDGQGQLKAIVTYDGHGVVPSFHNSYQPKAVTANVSAKKTLSGRPLQDGEFSFVLKDAKGEIISTVSNQAGVISFPELTFSETGSYQYTISEMIGNLAGMTYDATIHNVTIKVIDNNGQLAATVSYDGETTAPTFTNSYQAAEGVAQMQVTKTLTGRDLVDGEFSFQLLEGQTVLQVKTNNTAGAVIFDGISYDKVGTYNYTIKELDGNLPGVTYDTSEVQVQVVVTDEGGKLVPQITYVNDDATFENSYIKPTTKATITAKKNLVGRELQAGEFEFQLFDPAGDPLAQVKNDQAGEISFPEQTFDAVGTYNYTIKEISGNEENMKYDTKTVTATVTVTEKDGQLSAAVTYTDNDGQDNTANTFNNEYREPQVEPTQPVDIVMEAVKHLSGRELQADEFEFALLDDQGKEIQRGKNDANGQIKFDTLTFDAEGTRTYTIKEIKGTEKGMIYDSKTVTVTIAITKTGDILTSTVTYSDDDQKDNTANQFDNLYEVPTGSITLQKVDSESGEVLAGAEFSIYNEAGQLIKDNVVTDENGLAVIDGLLEGNYYAVETKAPTGYQLDGTPMNFTVTADTDSASLVKENTLKDTGILLEKIDGDTGQALAGATFELRDADGNLLETEFALTSDENGLIYLVGLTDGDYTLTEIEAPTGYQLDQTPQEFTVKNGEMTQLQVKNYKTTVTTPEEPKEDPKETPKDDTSKERPKLPMTGSVDSFNLMLLGIFSLFAGSVLLLRRRKRND